MGSEGSIPVFPGSVPASFAGESLLLMPDRAIWWPRRQTLIVADVHLGKGAAFRNAGLPIPSGSSAKDLGRLAALLADTSAHRLVVLGDLIHGKSSHQPALFEAVATWRAAHPAVEMLLVRGNHDRSAGRVPAEWNILEAEEPMEDDGLIFSHAPRRDQPGAVLAGHVHPAISLRDFDRSAVRMPCFVFEGSRCAILPAFGSFTGGQTVERQEGTRVFACAGKRVVKVS